MKKTQGVPNPTIDYKMLVREPISPELISEYNRRKTFRFIKAKKKYKVSKREYPFIDHIHRKGYFTREQLELMLEIIMTLTPKNNELFYNLSTLYVYKDWDELNEIFNQTDWIAANNDELKSDIKKLNSKSTEIQDELIQLKENLNAQQENINVLNGYIRKLEQSRTYIPLYVEIIDLINEAKSKGTEKIIMESYIHKVLDKHLKAGDNEYLNLKLEVHKGYSKLSNSFRLGFKGYRDRLGISL